jgi:hypothetical protein
MTVRHVLTPYEVGIIAALEPASGKFESLQSFKFEELVLAAETQRNLKVCIASDVFSSQICGTLLSQCLFQ